MEKNDNGKSLKVGNPEGHVAGTETDGTESYVMRLEKWQGLILQSFSPRQGLGYHVTEWV